MKYNDIIRFFAEKGVLLKCPSCGRESSWEIGYIPSNSNPNDISGVHSLTLALPGVQHNPLNPPFGASMLLITTTCVHCSYVRPYDYARIKAWVDANQDETPANE